jgi:predicted phosphodiesterase
VTPYPLTAILADLHANTPALDVAIADARARGVERFVCLGDVVGYGARPRQCLSIVMDLCVPGAVDTERDDMALVDGICLQGNHEDALLNSAEDFNPKARAAIEWTRDEIRSDPDRERGYAYWDFIDGLKPMRCDDRTMFAHGSPRDPVREYMLPRDIRDAAKMTANFQVMERDVCFVGHSHVPAVYREDGRLFLPGGRGSALDTGTDGEGEIVRELTGLARNRAIINVGSVGQPRDGDNRLSYATFDGERVTFIRLPYDFESAAAAIRAVPELPDYLADRLAVGR